MPAAATAALLAAALILAACGGPQTPGSPVSGTATAVGQATPTAGAQPAARTLPGVPFPPDQAQTLAGLLESASRIRGLEPTGPIEMRLIGRSEAADYLESTLDPGDREVLRLHQEVYRLLGLIPDDADLVHLQITLLRGLVLGFYDPDVKTLFVLQDLGLNSTVTRLTLVHELTHALQDQHYDLNAVDLRLRDDWDASMAYTDLVEGDARAVETEFANPGSLNRPRCDDSSFAVSRSLNIPVIIQRELQAPYSDGVCLISSDRSRLPDGVDSMFADPPRSTEQVLHPEKYLAGEEPRKVGLQPLAQTLGADWQQEASSTFGEFALQNLLLLGVTDTATVKSAAAGWGGDRWALYARDDGARLFQMTTVWDSEAEAREYWSVFLFSLRTRANGTPPAAPGATTVKWVQGGKTLQAAIKGDSVTMVVSTDASAADTAAAALGLQ